MWLRVWLRAACLLAFLLVSLEIHAGTVTGKMQTERLSSGSPAVHPPKRSTEVNRYVAHRRMFAALLLGFHRGFSRAPSLGKSRP